MPLRLFGEAQSLILGSAPNAIEIGREGEAVLFRKGETPIGNLMAVDVPEELQRRTRYVYSFGNYFKMVVDPTAELLVRHYMDAAETQLIEKDGDYGVAEEVQDTELGLCFKWEKSEPFYSYPNGEPLSAHAPLAAMIPAFSVIEGQIGANGVLKNTADGGFMHFNKSAVLYIRRGDKKDSFVQIFDFKHDDTTAQAADGSGPLDLAAAANEDLAAVAAGTASVAQQQSAAAKIDWSQPVGTSFTWWLLLVFVNQA